MTYSCAIFEDLDGDLKHANPSLWSGGQGLKRVGQPVLPTPPRSDHAHNDTDELYDAQIRKLSHIIKKAKIQPGNRVLEIGSGWGSMAILIAQTIADTTVDTLTLSVQQQTLARERIKAAGLQDRITVHLMDYRAMPPHWEGKFDRVVSIEMIEAVGAEFLVTYWKQVDWAMKKKDGVGVVQVITIPEARACLGCDLFYQTDVTIGFERYIREIDFIRKWVSLHFLFHTLVFPHLIHYWSLCLNDQSKYPRQFYRIFPSDLSRSIPRWIPPYTNSPSANPPAGFQRTADS